MADTLIYRDPAGRWALLGTPDGRLDLRPITPAQVAALDSLVAPEIVEAGDGLPPTRDTRGELVYPVAHLRPYRARGVTLRLAFDGARWYRGRDVAVDERPAYHVSDEG